MLRPEQRLVLDQLTEVNTSLRPVVLAIGVRPLSYEERERLRDALLDELLETGLQDDDEPSARGREIEELIDFIGRS